MAISIKTVTVDGRQSDELDAIRAVIEQVGLKAVDHAARRMKSEQEKIQQLAMDYVPVDDGDMEKAIKLDEDTSGINRRKVFYVYVDPDVEADVGKSHGVKFTGDYMLWLHESEYDLGDKSKAKAAALGVRVGPKFMERAAAERENAVEDSVYNAVKEVL